MSKQDLSPLSAAAVTFDAELATYARLGELFLKTTLTSVKHLERANLTLGEIADCEGRLQAAGKQLIEALTAARQQQEDLSNKVVAHAPALQVRNTQLKELMSQMNQLGADVAGINSQVTSQNGDTEQPTQSPDPGAVSASVLALSERAELLATSAREAEFEELSTQAHALCQRLKAIGTKLQKAAGN